MRRLSLNAALAVLGVLVSPLPAGPQSVGTCTLALGASVEPRASLRAATSYLRFDVTAEGRVEEAVVSYRVVARTRRDGGVSLTVASGEASEVPGGADAAGLAVRCLAAGGDRPLVTSRPQEIASWRGSGVREGALRCGLDGVPASGHYSLPVRLAVVLD